MHYILASFLSSLSFAVLDNLNGIISKRLTPIQFAFWADLAGAVLFGVPTFLFFYEDFQRLTWQVGFIILGLGLLLNIGFISFITAMKRGSVTAAGVIGGSYPAVATLIGLLFFKEILSGLELVVVAVIIFAAVLSAMGTSLSALKKSLTKGGTIFAFGALLCWGIYYGFIQVVVDQIGWFLPIYLSYFFGLIFFGILGLASKQNKIFSKPPYFGRIIIATLIGFSGSSLYTYAITQGQISIVAPIAGTTPAFFVVIAYFLFKEKLNKKQWTGIALAVIGILVLSILNS